MEEFYEWIMKEGDIDAKKSKIEIAEQEGRGRCGIAKEKIKPGDIVLSVPQKLFISLEKAMTDELMSQIFKNAPLQLSLSAMLTAYLLKEKALGSESFWAPYFNVLPTHYTAMVNWKLEDDSFILRQGLWKEWKEFYNEWDQQYKAFLTGVQISLKNSSNPSHRESLQKLLLSTRDDFAWAAGTVHSRTCHFPTSVDPKSEVGTLVPFLDFLNHEFLNTEDQKKTAFFSLENDSYQIVSVSELEKGQELFICYAFDTNSHFAKYYGFLPNKNPFDGVSLECNLERIFEILWGEFSKESSSKKQEMIQEIQKCAPSFFENENCGKKGEKAKKVFRPLKKVEFFFNMAPPEMDETLSFFSRACSSKNPKSIRLTFSDSSFHESIDHMRTAQKRLKIAFHEILSINYKKKPDLKPKNEVQAFLVEFHEAELAKLNLILENI